MISNYQMFPDKKKKNVTLHFDEKKEGYTLPQQEGNTTCSSKEENLSHLRQVIDSLSLILKGFEEGLGADMIEGWYVPTCLMYIVRDFFF